MPRSIRPRWCIRSTRCRSRICAFGLLSRDPLDKSRTDVIPAKAGIHIDLMLLNIKQMDSRFRGNDDLTLKPPGPIPKKQHAICLGKSPLAGETSSALRTLSGYSDE